VPRRRKKDVPATLYKEVLAAMPDVETVPPVAVPAVLVPQSVPAAAPVDPEPAAPILAAPPNADSDLDDEPVESEADEVTEPDDERPVADAPAFDDVRDMPADEGPVHRPLIRATLPRPEGTPKDARPVPEFTVRQNGGRGNGHGGAHYRGDRSKMRGNGEGRARNGQAGANGNRAHAAPRFGRPARGGSQGGFRGGQPRHTGRKGRG
jgi:hypothetical protein